MYIYTCIFKFVSIYLSIYLSAYVFLCCVFICLRTFFCVWVCDLLVLQHFPTKSFWFLSSSKQNIFISFSLILISCQMNFSTKVVLIGRLLLHVLRDRTDLKKCWKNLMIFLEKLQAGVESKYLKVIRFYELYPLMDDCRMKGKSIIVGFEYLIYKSRDTIIAVVGLCVLLLEYWSDNFGWFHFIVCLLFRFVFIKFDIINIIKTRIAYVRVTRT